MKQPNVIYLMFDQLAAQVLRLYGADEIATPNLDALAARGVTFDNMISTYPVCTPFRSMWLTGRHPQTTGHVINFLQTRHDEIGWGDVFSRAGYDTGYVGKWHLGRGSFPEINGADYVPEGRDRLGFRWWRGYNFHTDYFRGTVNLDNWRCKKWDGYETDALNGYAFEFLDRERDKEKPFCLLINPHPPHGTHGQYAPDEYLARIPEDLPLPPNWDGTDRAFDLNAYRLYLAMVLACDAMVGDLVAGLEQRGLLDSTLLIVTSDHGTNLGAHRTDFWGKKLPWEENVKVPMVAYLKGVFEGEGRRDTLTAPVDLLPTLCGLCGIPVPRTVEGHDLSASWKGEADSFEQDAVYLMNFTKGYDYLADGGEWRGLRTKTHTYARFLDGRELLFDNVSDPGQRNNLIGQDLDLAARLSSRTDELMRARGDALIPGLSYAGWFDEQRRVIRNAYGPLAHPEGGPDWSLMR